MLTRSFRALFIFALSAWGSAYANPANANAIRDDQAKILEDYGRVPLSFEANRGQTDPVAQFISRGRGYSLFLTAEEAVLNLKKDLSSESKDESTVVRMRFLDAAKNPRAEGMDALESKSNYFLGRDSKRWLNNIPQYAKVMYQEVYPGINLVFYGNQNQLEYDFIVAPGADPNRIKLAYHGIRELILEDNGDLALHTGSGKLIQHKPIIYQEIDGERRAIEGNYRKTGTKQIGFRIASYDKTKPLVIDPVLVYSTYLGGGNLDFGNDIAVDSAGNAYVTGSTGSTNFPTASPLQPNPGNSGTVTGDAFVAKLNPQGNALVYSTYLGGSDTDQGNGIAVDANGAAYITGQTFSGNFPTTAGAFQATNSGTTEAFIAKLAPDGATLVYSTYLGGNNLENGYDVAVDTAGNAYVTGITASRAQFGTPGFPTQNPIQGPNFNLAGGSSDAFVTKLSPTGSALVYSTYLGGSDFENVNAFGASITVDAAGNAYVIGETRSSDFPTVSPLQSTFGGGVTDNFVAKLNPQGSALVFSTYLGGSGDETAGGIAIDSATNVHVAGSTASTNFPTATPLQPAFAGGPTDAFVSKLNATGSAFVYSTYLGGSSNSDSADSIAVDTAGNVYVTGSTVSSNFPTVDTVRPKAIGSDAFVSKLNPTGSALIYSTFLGGNNTNSSLGIALDGVGNAYVTGRTNSTDFSTATSVQPNFGGGLGDAFVARIADSAGTPSPSPGTLQFNPSSYTVSEAAGSQTITVTRTGNSSGAVAVNFATSNGSAVAGSDYTATSGTLNFAAGVTSQTFPVVITNDTTAGEGNETVNLTLSNPAGGATLGAAAATVTIMDDDAAPAPAPATNDDDGGCAINPHAPFDPLLMLLILMAVGYLIRRKGLRR